MGIHISGPVDHTVTLGEAGYGRALTVDRSGSVTGAYVQNSYYGADGVDVGPGLTNVSIVN